jgi:hypothetical protein
MVKAGIMLVLVGIGFSTALNAQNDQDWKTYKPGGASAGTASPDSIDVREKLDFNKPDGTISVAKDSRVDAVIEFMGTPVAPDPVQIDGYRVQIFFDKDINKARDIKASFLSSYPKVKAYMVWAAPNHYVQAGNFRNELQAMQFQNFIKEHFPETTIVRTRVNLPDLELELEGYEKK